MAGWYEVEELECSACAALAKHQSSARKPLPGVKQYVVDRRPADDVPRLWTPGSP